MLKIEQLRAQCRLDSDQTSEDDLLLAYGKAAVRLIENKTGRVLYRVGDAANLPPVPLPVNALELGADVELAALLLVAHWFRHREAVTDVARASLPLAFDDLVQPYRWFSL